MGFRAIGEQVFRSLELHQPDRYLPQPAALRLSVCGLYDLPRVCDRQVTHLLSIYGHPRHCPQTPRWIDLADHFQFQFDDVEQDSQNRVAPGRVDVQSVLRIGQDLVNRSSVLPVHLLIHCYAGISRSTATALAILMQVYGQGREEEAVRHLFRIRPQAAPNPRIVLETDLILGCGGQLVAAVAWS